MSALDTWAVSPVGRWHYLTSSELGPVAACGRWRVELPPEVTQPTQPPGACEACARLVDTRPLKEAPRDDATMALKRQRDREVQARIRRGVERVRAGERVTDVAREVGVTDRTLHRYLARRPGGYRAEVVS